MDKKLVLELDNHNVYYVKLADVSYYITIPKNSGKTNMCLEIKSKMGNYNLDSNDEVWVMENVKNTFSHIDGYNITLVLPILNEEDTSILEKMDTDKFEVVDKLLAKVINGSYTLLKENKLEISNQVVLINNDRYKVFMNWFIARYRDRIILKNMLDLIQLYNVTATSYKKFETPIISFVVGSYASEVNAPKVMHDTEEESTPTKLVPQASSGHTSYWLLAAITLIVSAVVIFMAFVIK